MNSQKIVYSPVSLWRDFDGVSLPLDTKTEAEFEAEGVIYTYLYFNGADYGDGVSRVYGLFARKKGKKNLPAIIIVNEPGKQINEKETAFWAKKGYAAFSFDNTGETDACNKFTVYPQSVSYANFAYSGRHMTNCDTNAKETSRYHWAVNTRRAITFAAEQECVDVSSIGLLASKDSAVVACMVAAFDDRLSACALIFGVCHQEVEIINGQTREQLEQAEERERWFAGIAPQSYLMHMQTPFFLCIGANSSLSDLDKTYDALNLIPKETPWALWIADRLLDSGGESFVKNLDKWLTLRLKKQIDNALLPVVDFRVLNKKLNIIVRVPDDDEAQDIAIYFAREASKNSVRNWNKVSLQNLADGVYRAEVEVYDTTQSCYAFCNIKYRGGLVLSGNLKEINADGLRGVLPAKKTKTLYNGQMGVGEFQVYSPSSCEETRIYDEKRLEVKNGPDDIKGVCGSCFATFALNDSKYIKNDDGLLAFDVYSKEEQELVVSVVVDYGQNQKVYGVSQKLLGGEMWQKICLALGELKGERGRAPDGWSQCEVLCFEAQNEIILNNLILT